MRRSCRKTLCGTPHAALQQKTEVDLKEEGNLAFLQYVKGPLWNAALQQDRGLQRRVQGLSSARRQPEEHLLAEHWRNACARLSTGSGFQDCLDIANLGGPLGPATGAIAPAILVLGIGTFCQKQFHRCQVAVRRSQHERSIADLACRVRLGSLREQKAKHLDVATGCRAMQ